VIPLRDGSGDDSGEPNRVCPVDGRPLPSRRARFCSGRCRMHAHRLRHQIDVAAGVDVLTAELRRLSQFTAACVYECPSCQERYLGERRCPACSLFTRNLGRGGLCASCDQPVVLAELLPGLLPASTAVRRRPSSSRSTAGADRART